MSTTQPVEQSFSQWDGKTPFFNGAPTQGRRVYLTAVDESGAFLAYGVAPTPRDVRFIVRGANPSEEERFIAEIRREGAQLTHGAPPFEIYTGGDKAPPPSGGSTPPPGSADPQQQLLRKL